MNKFTKQLNEQWTNEMKKFPKTINFWLMQVFNTKRMIITESKSLQNLWLQNNWQF